MRRVAIVVLAGVLAAAACTWAAGKKPVEDKRSVGELIRALGGELPSHRLRAAKALGAKGPEALPAAVKALKEKDWRVRRGATDALAAMGTDANSAVPALIAALADADAWVRDGAASALGRVGKDVEPAAKALAAAVTDNDPWVRESAVAALKSVTQDKKILLPAAIAAIKIPHSGWNVRRHAVDILHRHGKGHKPVVPAIVEMLENPSQGMWDCTGRAFETLQRFGAEEKAVPAFMKMLKTKRRGGRARAAEILGKIGKKAAAAVPALEAVAKKDKDERARKAAKAALEQITGTKPE